MTTKKFYECGICDHIHPWEFDGDCRNDATRLTMDNVGFDDELLTWEDRLEADSRADDRADDRGER